jgi:phage-related protein
MTQISVKPIVWIGSSLNDIKEFPEDVRGIMGYALYLAQTGEKHQSARPLKGLGGAKVLEITDDCDGIAIEQFTR